MTRSQKATGDLRHVISIIGLYTSTIERVIVTQWFKQMDDLKYITEYQLRGMRSLNTGNTIAILRFKRCYNGIVDLQKVNYPVIKSHMSLSIYSTNITMIAFLLPLYNKFT